MKETKTKIAGWGNYPTASCTLTRPESSQKIPVWPQGTIARGLGRSYGDASLSKEGMVVLMERLNRLLAFDERTGLLRAEAGVTLKEIIDVFLPRGWFLPVVPGTKFVTLGGSFAADIHGKNHHKDGSFSCFVPEIALLLADGTHRICSSQTNADLFWATAGGMGLTGIITELTVQLVKVPSKYVTVKHTAAKNLDEALRLFHDNSLEDDYSVAWIDCLSSGPDFGRSVLISGHHASQEELKNNKVPRPSPNASVPFVFPNWALNAYSVKAFNAAYYASQAKKTEPFIADTDRFFFPLDSLHNWKRIYGSRGFVQYQFAVPHVGARECLRKVLDRLVKSQRASFLAVLKRFGEEGEGMLSFPMPGYTLALDLPVTDGLFALLDELDALVLEHKGRIYLAKDARTKPEIMAQMYPRLVEWQQIKRTIDPQCVFKSDLSARLKLC